jgi:hypothetical protein
LICAFAYSASTIFRGQYSTGMNKSGSPPRSCICKRVGAGLSHFIHTSDGFVREGGRGHTTKQPVVWGWVAGFSVMVLLLGCAETERCRREVSVRPAWRKVLDFRGR